METAAAMGQVLGAGLNSCEAQAKREPDWTVEQAIDRRISKLMREVEQLQLAKSRLGGVGGMSANEFRKMLGGIGY